MSFCKMHFKDYRLMREGDSRGDRGAIQRGIYIMDSFGSEHHQYQFGHIGLLMYRYLLSPPYFLCQNHRLQVSERI